MEDLEEFVVLAEKTQGLDGLPKAPIGSIRIV